jgi:hypothetical protein
MAILALQHQSAGSYTQSIVVPAPVFLTLVTAAGPALALFKSAGSAMLLLARPGMLSGAASIPAASPDEPDAAETGKTDLRG